MACKISTVLGNVGPFSGCDGKPVSDEILKIWLGNAIEFENYERAAEIRDELKRRRNEFSQKTETDEMENHN